MGQCLQDANKVGRVPTQDEHLKLIVVAKEVVRPRLRNARESVPGSSERL
jgi:hypothetical protein